MAQNFIELITDTKPQVKEDQRITSKINNNNNKITCNNISQTAEDKIKELDTAKGVRGKRYTQRNTDEN